ncbi:MAG: hypothetical protein JWM80_1989 [Cyanobacteria bacterium RYN_339]|nr:hypothetical protein [Cyanobacteria bacterium RYN_339]
MSEQQEPNGRPTPSKVVPMLKPEAPSARSLPSPGERMEGGSLDALVERRAEELVERAIGKVMAQQNHILQQNLEQHSVAQTRALEKLSGQFESLLQERNQLEGTAQKMVAQATEVQIGARAANAIVYHPGGEDAPQLANVEVGCQEISYPMFATHVGQALNIARGMVSRVARASGIWDNPEYHAQIRASVNTVNPRYRPRAVDKMREFLENPAAFGVAEGHPDWGLIKHYKKQKAKGAAADDPR